MIHRDKKKNQLELIKMKYFYTCERHFKENGEKKPTDWVKIFSNHTPDSRLLSRIHKKKTIEIPENTTKFFEWAKV